MAIAELRSVLSIFGGSSPTEEEQAALFGEALLMVLARASSSDANISPLEIETIQQIMQQRTGQELTEVDIRRAARAELYESTRMRKYLRGVQHQLKSEDRIAIAQSLADVIKSDTDISVLEIDYFNGVAEALQLTAAELVGLAA
jgi:uncharacterized tellurite resistance protein B-like protein